MTLTVALLSLAGGILIGLAAFLLWVLNGRIAGISGICAAALSRQGGQGWRWTFLGGLLVGGGISWGLFPQNFAITLDASVPYVVLAGALVGVGTRLGSGCTSGHGICGIGRLSTRSMAATGTFVGVGIVTVLLLRSLGVMS